MAIIHIYTMQTHNANLQWLEICTFLCGGGGGVGGDSELTNHEKQRKRPTLSFKKYIQNYSIIHKKSKKGKF